MSHLLRVGALDSETLQHSNERLQIIIKPSEPRPQINDKIDVKMVSKKNTGFCQKRVQFGDFFLKISFVYCLASHPLVRMHQKKNRLNQPKWA